jgi:hypothetical protein
MAFAVNAYSETPFSAEPSDVIAYPLGTNVSSQTGNFTTQANAEVNVTGNSVHFINRSSRCFFISSCICYRS